MNYAHTPVTVRENVRPDLRPAISGWRLLLDYPRQASEEEIQLFLLGSFEPEDLYVYKYVKENQPNVIVQFFTNQHTYIGGGEHAATHEHLLVMTKDEQEIYNNVGRF